MIISGLDFFLINALIYVSGVGTGLLICCKYKDKLMIRSRSRENLSQAQERTDSSKLNKGKEIAQSLVEMLS